MGGISSVLRSRVRRTAAHTSGKSCSDAVPERNTKQIVQVSPRVSEAVLGKRAQCQETVDVLAGVVKDGATVFRKKQVFCHRLTHKKVVIEVDELFRKSGDVVNKRLNRMGVKRWQHVVLFHHLVVEDDLRAGYLRILGALRQNPDCANPGHKALYTFDRVMDFAVSWALALQRVSCTTLLRGRRTNVLLFLFCPRRLVLAPGEHDIHWVTVLLRGETDLAWSSRLFWSAAL